MARSHKYRGYPKSWSRSGRKFQRAADLAARHRGKGRKASKWKRAEKRAKRRLLSQNHSKRWMWTSSEMRKNPRRGKKRAHRGNRNKKRGGIMNHESRYERDVWSWRSEAWRKERRGGYKSKKKNPPISERDLTVMKRVIAVHHRDNVKHGRGGKKRNPYYTSPARYAKMSVKARARYRQAQRAARMRRNPGRSSGLCDVMARAGKRWYKVGSRMSKDDAQREKKYQLGAELNGHKVTHVYIRPAR